MKNEKHKKPVLDHVTRYWLRITKPARMEAQRRTELPKSVSCKKGRLRYLV